jgi:hypothetical protein
VSFAEKDSKGNVISDTYATTKDVAKQSGITIGTILPFLMTKIPAGWLSLESGQEVERNVYPELWAWVQENAPILTEENWQAASKLQTSVGYYSSGDGSTTFRLPRLLDFVQGGALANSGNFARAGLPNIYGWINANDNYWFVDENGGGGAFYVEKNETYKSSNTASSVNSIGRNGFKFDASRSSTIYGNGDTVQPKSIKMVYCVKAFGTAANQGTIDIQALADDLAYRGIEVGAIMPFLSKTVPAGWLSLEAGQEVSRTVYKDLWNWVQTNAPVISETDWQTKAKSQTSVGYYSTGDGSTTFRLPKIVDFIQGSALTDSGNFAQPGLPNITGGLPWIATWQQNDKATGVFSWKNARAMQSTVTSTGSGNDDLTFDASKSNSIYGNSTTVQPPAIKMVYCVKAFSTVVNPGKIEAQTLADSKADINLSNLDSTGKKTAAGLAMPSDTYIVITNNFVVDESMSRYKMSYTAPANGYATLAASVPATNIGQCYIYIYISNNDIGTICHENVTSAQHGLYAIFPCKKGDKIVFMYTKNLTNIGCKFVYAEGEI